MVSSDFPCIPYNVLLQTTEVFLQDYVFQMNKGVQPE